MKSQVAVRQVAGLGWASAAAVAAVVAAVERALRCRPRVLAVEANVVSRTTNVTHDPDHTDVAQESGWVRDCGCLLAHPASSHAGPQAAARLPLSALSPGRISEVVLMRSNPPDVPGGAADRQGTRCKMRQKLGWPIGYNTIAMPIAAGVFVPTFGLGLRPEIAALSMSGSCMIVAVNARLHRRLNLPAPSPRGHGSPPRPVALDGKLS